MKIEGYFGICAACFEPIRCGEEATIRERHRHFHKSCIENCPNNYYVKLERRLLKQEQTKAAKNANDDCPTCPPRYCGTCLSGDCIHNAGRK